MIIKLFGELDLTHGTTALIEMRAFKVLGCLGCNAGSLVLVFFLLRLLVWAMLGRSG